MLYHFSRATLSSAIFVPLDELTVDVTALRKVLTVHPRYANLPDVPVYVEKEGYFGFPRHSRLVTIDEYIDERVEGEPVDVKFTGVLREAQEPVIEGFKKAMENHTDMLLEAETGAGKTVLMLKMFTMLKRTALVVVPKTDLLRQWIDRIMEFTDVDAEDIGIVRQNTCDFRGKKIVIGMLHSLSRRDYGDEFRNYFGAVFFDELSKLGALHFSKVASLFPATYRIGCSATLERPDGLSSVFKAHLGDYKIKPLYSEQPVPRVLVYEYAKPSGVVPHYIEDTISRRGVLLSYLSRNHERTAKIAYLAKKLAESGRQTMVISERIGHLEEIRDILVQKLGFPVADVGLYLGRTPDSRRKEIARDCRLILATTSMLSMGTDIPTLRGLVFGTPLSQVTQVLGRIRRVNPEAKNPIVIDFIDTAYEEAKAWYYARRRIYKDMGCEMKKIGGKQ